MTFTTLSQAAYPELSVSNVTNTGATLTLANHTGNWWYENEDAATLRGGGRRRDDRASFGTGREHELRLHGLEPRGMLGRLRADVWYSRKAFTTTGPLTVSVGGKTSDRPDGQPARLHRGQRLSRPVVGKGG